MKNLNEYINDNKSSLISLEEKLIINKDYNKNSNKLLDIIKQIKCAWNNTDEYVDKYCIRVFFLSCTTKTDNCIQELINFTGEIFDVSEKYDHKKFVIYYKHGSDPKYEQLQQLIQEINKLGTSELLFETNKRATRSNFQLIKVEDTNLIIYILGRSLYKNNEFKTDLNDFKILMFYND